MTLEEKHQLKSRAEQIVKSELDGCCGSQIEHAKAAILKELNYAIDLVGQPPRPKLFAKRSKTPIEATPIT